MTLVRREDWQPQGIDSLEPRAWTALREVDQCILVTAGAGAGKTEFLAQKAAYLLQTGICSAPHRVLAISFKRDAARNLAERVSIRCPPEQSRRFDSMTFDTFTKSMLDRFRKAIPDPWMPPMDYEIDQNGRQTLVDFCDRNAMHNINSRELERAVASMDLPFPENPNGIAHSVSNFWSEHYENFDRVMLSFPMINRLVKWMIRENPYIKKALQKTYHFVFIDEFQDTTYAQFDLLNTAFRDGQARLTAVGDDKQRIMVWAGAMHDAFDRFEQVYEASRVSLISNWRSHEDLVAIQHAMARTLDSSVEQPEARGVRSIDGDVAAIWEFPDTLTERNTVARWIAREVQEHIVEPHRVALLVRTHANNVEDGLAPAFGAHGLRLRNLARNLNGISIQDILSEDLTRLLLSVLRLGALPNSQADWSFSQRNLNYLYGISPDDYAAHDRHQRTMQDFVRALRCEMREQRPNLETATQLASQVRDFWSIDLIRQSFKAYRRQQDFDRAWNGFIALLSECLDGKDNWPGVLDEFEGKGQAPLMTIHKSKGLEFHTMIFFGLDNQTWWNLNRENQEEISTFFVALTRAEQRAFFTRCRARGRAINWLEQLLQPAGLRKLDGANLI